MGLTNDSIKSVGIIGAGLMGSTIAEQLASQGLDVIVVDNNADQLERARQRSAQTGIQFVPAIQSLAAVDFVLEAIIELEDAKQAVLRELEAVVDESCILASNTSSLLIADLATAVKHGRRFLGVHYNNPADFNPVVEVIAGPETDPAVVEGISNLITNTGKCPILCKDTSGFVLNRQSLPYLNEAVRCLQDGLADAASIDAIAIEALGVGLGPLAVINLIGLPVMAAASINLARLGPNYAAAPFFIDTEHTNNALLENASSDNPKWRIMDQPGDFTNRQLIQDRLLGALLFAAKDILEQQLTSAENLHLICIEALGYRQSTVQLMDQLAAEDIARLIDVYCAA